MAYSICSRDEDAAGRCEETFKAKRCGAYERANDLADWLFPFWELSLFCHWMESDESLNIVG